MWKNAKPKAKPEILNTVSGTIDEILDPKLLENFSSFAIVRMGGRLVKGNFPFLDLNFKYNFKCYCQKASFGDGAEYIISEPGVPPFTPVPLNRSRLKSIFQQFLGMSDSMADGMIEELVCNPSLVGVNFDSFEPEILLNRLKPTQESFYFRYPFIQLLQNFWSPLELSNYSVSQLLDIGREFNVNPELFAYEWMNRFNLPELTVEKVLNAFARLSMAVPIELRTRNAIYGNCKLYIKKHGSLCFTQAQMEDIRSNMPYFPALAFKILRQVKVRLSTERSANYYFLTPIWENFKRMTDGLARIMSQPIDPTLFLKRPRVVGEPGARLTRKQADIVALSSVCPFMILDAPGGVGKTFTALRVAALSGKRSILACAHFGRVASMLRKTAGWGSGYTIHRLAHLIKNNTKIGQRLQSRSKRVFIDEGSHMTVELFGLIFLLFPEMKTLFVMGDSAQMRPPSGIPIWEALCEKYRNTAFMHTLDQNMRADQENALQAATLIDNNMKIREGRTDLVYTRKLDPDAALILWPRARIPLDMEGNQPNKRDQRVKLIKQTIEPLIRYLGFGSDYQIVTLRHETIRDLTEAIGEIRDTVQNTKSNSRIYRPGDKITFTKNYYPPREQTLPRDAKKRVEMLKSAEYRCRTTQVNNNEILVIEVIVDIDPVTGEETPVVDTVHLKPTATHQRIIRFVGGGQINMSIIPLASIFPGIVSTISSAQGTQARRIIGWIDRRDIAIPNPKWGPLIKRDTIYTLASRAERQVIIVGDAIYDAITHTDLGTAIKWVRPPPDLSSLNWLPNYTGPSLEELLKQVRPTEEPENQSEEEDADDDESLAD